MTIVRFNTFCARCGLELLVRIECLGERVRCPQCDHCFQIADSTTREREDGFSSEQSQDGAPRFRLVGAFSDA